MDKVPLRMAPAPAWSVRPATPQDRPWLLRIYASTREEELAATGWPEEAKAEFLRMQFEAQDRYYRQVYPDASFALVEVSGEPAGRLYVSHAPEEIRVIDIALLPPFRGRGLGAAILRTILDEADATSRRVSIHVEQHNPALRLYERLGFQVRDARGLYYFLQRPPDRAAS
jgi:ribosomal protein S18 acetylase RimI-like enzyme